MGDTMTRKEILNETPTDIMRGHPALEVESEGEREKDGGARDQRLTNCFCLVAGVQHPDVLISSFPPDIHKELTNQSSEVQACLSVLWIRALGYEERARFLPMVCG